MIARFWRKREETSGYKLSDCFLYLSWSLRVNILISKLDDGTECTQ